jgi:tripartite-type tricarboxylate transporter receptor subunit TctC
LSKSPYFIVVASSYPAKSLKDMLALAKAEPNKHSYASLGPGTAMHIAYEVLARDAGVQMLHVPYKGLQLALPDVLSGRVTTLMSGMAIAGAQAKAGKLRVLAVSTASRSPLMPDVPTVAESGVPGYDIVAWFGLFAPAQTPAAVVSRVSSELRSFLATREAREAYRNLGHEAFATTPGELAALVKSDTAKFAKVIREANIKAE